MKDSTRLALTVILVAIVDVLLCLLIPALALLELFLTLAAILLITAGVSILHELIDYHRCQQEQREIELELLRRQLLPPAASTFHRRSLRRSRNVRTRCH
jgi:hypothetical protein